MEFKKLSAVEMVDAVGETANVLVEEDGVIKRAPKDEVNVQANWAETDSSSPAFIKNKPTKELVYEWNFSADDEVYELIENVDDDISWLAYKTEDSDFEIEYITYQYCYDGNGSGYIYPDSEQKNIIRSSNIPYESSFYNVKEFNFQQFTGETYGCDPWLPDTIYSNIFSGGFNYNYWYCFFTNHYHLIDESYVEVALGGSLAFYEDYNPIKTIRIYKITY